MAAEESTVLYSVIIPAYNAAKTLAGTLVALKEQTVSSSAYEVIVVDDLSNSGIEVLDNIAQITGKKPAFERFDLADRERTDNFFKQNQWIKAIIHFAA